MKLIELIGSVEALNKLSETKLPAFTSFKLSKFLKEVSPDIENYHKIKKEKIEEYGTPQFKEDGTPDTDKDGNQLYSFKKEGSDEISENGKKYVEEMVEIENSEITTAIPEIKISDIGNSEIEPKDLIALNWLIKE